MGRSSFLRPSFQATDARPPAKKFLAHLSFAIGLSVLTTLTLASSNARADPAPVVSVDVDLSAIGLRTGTDDRIAPGRAPVVLRYPGSVPKARILLTPPPSAQPVATRSATPPAPAILAPVESAVATPATTPRLVPTPNRVSAPAAAAPQSIAFPNPGNIAPAPLLPVTRAPMEPAPVATQPAPAPAAAQEASLGTPEPVASNLPSPTPASHRLRFEAGASAFLADTRAELELIAAELMRHSSRIEIRAYAGAPNDLSSPVRRLSLKRGLAVRQYLVDQGVLQSRIDVHALGGVRDNGPGERVDIVLSRR